MNDEAKKRLQNEILRIKKRFGNRLLIPAHHYIASELVEIADLSGDSYKLAVDVSRSDAEFVLFCGVSFMAEGAAILAKPNQKIFSPDFAAGCPMADMINAAEAKKACEWIHSVQGESPVPVVYMNSYIDSKAFAGLQGGSVCTSSNAEKILAHYFNQKKRVFFFPDQNLGHNTALAMGLSEEEIAIIDANNQVKEVSGMPHRNLKKVKIFLWDGFCPLHHHFSQEQIRRLKEVYPQAEFLVHPEVKNVILSRSHWSGSTQAILARLKEYASVENETKRELVVATEATFVQRMAKEFPQLSIFPFEPIPCDTMQQITIEKSLSVLKALELAVFEGAQMPSPVTVDQQLKGKAAVALKQMIAIVEG